MDGQDRIVLLISMIVLVLPVLMEPRVLIGLAVSTVGVRPEKLVRKSLISVIYNDAILHV